MIVSARGTGKVGQKKEIRMGGEGIREGGGGGGKGGAEVVLPRHNNLAHLKLLPTKQCFAPHNALPQ